MISNRNHNILYLVAGAYIGYLGIKIWKGVITGEATSNPILLGLFATLFIAAAAYLLFISGKYFLTHKGNNEDTAQTEEENDETALTDTESDEAALPDKDGDNTSQPDADNDEASLPNKDNALMSPPEAGEETVLSDTEKDGERP